MKDTVHLDRETLMNKQLQKFPELYEIVIRKLEIEKGIPFDLREKLHAKRKFGVEKYGDKSFQGSLENALATPSYEDLKEEVIDAINYTLNICFQNIFRTEHDPDALKILESLLSVYELADNARIEKINE